MMTNKFIKKREKIRAQMKSRFYYWFWGAATVTVAAGQFYVGSGYRQMARSLDRWFDETIEIITTPKIRRDSGGYYMPVPTPDDYGMTIIE
tara:strand:+ start:183 stop:455 length:273 start_codon:yes stop_codon:yes gene_type:complete